MTTPEWLDLGLRLILAYLLGSVSGSLVLGRLRGVDIRNQGSGNAGGTNALRTQGIRFALLVVLIDIGKGVLAVLLIPGLPLGLEIGQIVSEQQAVAAVGAVAGHIWPLYFGFRGGKGAATAVGAMASLSPIILPAVALIWVSGIILSGYVGLSTILAALTLWPSLYWLGGGTTPTAYYLASLAITVLVIFAHRSNLQRLWQGNENRFQRARLLHRWLERRSRA